MQTCKYIDVFIVCCIKYHMHLYSFTCALHPLIINQYIYRIILLIEMFGQCASKIYRHKINDVYC